MIKESLKIIGKIKCRVYDQTSLCKEEKIFNEKLRENYKNGIISREDFTQRFIFGKVKFEETRKNVISLQGFEAVAKFLIGDNTFAGGIDTAILGDGTGIPSQTDTTLFSEVYRNEMASRSSQSNQVLMTAFFDEGEVSGAFTEFGNCILGGTANEKLWSHIAGIYWTKDENATMTVSQLYTINND